MRRPGFPLALGGAVVAVFVAAGVLAPLLAPYPPRASVGGALEAPSARHLLGTNELGQDLWSQLIWGARASLATAVVAVSLGTVAGTLVGASSGLFGEAFDLVAMRTVDVFLAVPAIPLVVVIASLAGPSGGVVMGVVALATWPFIARTVRSQALTLRHRGFLSAARGFGGGPFHLLRRHLVPTLGPLVVTLFATFCPVAIFLETGLAYLGLGDPFAVSWGQMLDRALGYPGLYFTSLWTWSVLPPGLAITAAVLGFTLLGVGLDSWFNPRLRTRRSPAGG